MRSTHGSDRLARLALVVAVALVPGAARAQAPVAPAGTLEGLAVEGYFTRYRLDAAATGRVALSGLGARLLWSSDATGIAAGTPRSAFGLYADWAPDDGHGVAVAHAGMQGDLSLRRTPLFGWVRPLASLGAGVLRARETVEEPRLTPTDVPRPPARLATRTTTALAIAPSLGARLGAWRKPGVRIDLRDAMTVARTTRHNPQLVAGLSLPF